MTRREHLTPEVVDGEIELRPPNNQSQAKATGELAEILRQHTDLDGLISEGMKTAEDGSVEAARSLVLMNRVALVFADPDDKTTVYEKLNRAGCPPEVYYQLREMPEFKQVLHKAISDYIVLPRIGGMMVAMSNAAMLGDPRAAGRCIEFSKMLEGTDLDAMADDISRIQDDDAYAREILETLKDVKKLSRDLGITEQDAAAKERAKMNIKKHTKTVIKSKVDHSLLHSKNKESTDEA